MDKQIHKSGDVYDNEIDRRNGLLAAKRRYGNQPWHCQTCNVTISRGNKTHHEKTKKHVNKLLFSDVEKIN